MMSQAACTGCKKMLAVQPSPAGAAHVPSGFRRAQTLAQQEIQPTFYRRPLSEELIAMQSDRGKDLFKSALQAGYAESYFNLAANFITQAEPAYCGLSCLAMILNTLEIDPGIRWKGVWRWYAEDMLDCCAPLERVEKQGITFNEFACLATCNGLGVKKFYADASTKEHFIKTVKETCRQDKVVLAVSYSRKALKQTGDGHFSPVAAYDPETDRVLILDVARFKYPPYWVTMDMLWESLLPVDQETQRSRGYFLLEKSEIATPMTRLVQLNADQYSWPSLIENFKHIFCSHDKVNSIEELAKFVLDHHQLVLSFRKLGSPIIPAAAGEAQKTQRDELIKQVTEHQLYARIDGQFQKFNGDTKRLKLDHDEKKELQVLLTLLFLSLPSQTFGCMNSELVRDLEQLASLPLKEEMKKEVAALRCQMDALESQTCGCGEMSCKK